MARHSLIIYQRYSLLTCCCIIHKHTTRMRLIREHRGSRHPMYSFHAHERSTFCRFTLLSTRCYTKYLQYDLYSPTFYPLFPLKRHTHWNSSLTNAGRFFVSSCLVKDHRRRYYAGQIWRQRGSHCLSAWPERRSRSRYWAHLQGRSWQTIESERRQRACRQSFGWKTWLKY